MEEIELLFLLRKA